jgi:hypothetical protein
VQEANRQYDQGQSPGMLRRTASGDLETTRQIIDEIFATSDRGKAEALIVEHSKFFDSVIGTRGATGKNIINARTHYNNLFEEVVDEATLHHIDDSGLDETLLNNLEESV